MSWHYLQEQGEASSAPCFADGAPLPPSRKTPVAEQLCLLVSETGACTASLCGTMSGPSTVDLGAGGLACSPEGSPAPSGPPLGAAGVTPSTSGPKCSASSVRSRRLGSSRRTCNATQSSRQLATCYGWATVARFSRHPPRPWARLTPDLDGGWLPTPTAKQTMFSPSMAKWPAYELVQAMFGESIRPAISTWLMGWPAGWTDASAPLGMDRFRKWCSRSLEL